MITSDVECKAMRVNACKDLLIHTSNVIASATLCKTLADANTKALSPNVIYKVESPLKEITRIGRVRKRHQRESPKKPRSLKRHDTKALRHSTWTENEATKAKRSWQLDAFIDLPPSAEDNEEDLQSLQAISWAARCKSVISNFRHRHKGFLDDVKPRVVRHHVEILRTWATRRRRMLACEEHHCDITE